MHHTHAPVDHLTVLRISDPQQLDATAIAEIAGGRPLRLEKSLLDAISAQRREVLELLSDGSPVYGVNTGMGAASEVPLDVIAQSRHQNNLMLARAVGSAPWLTRPETRAVIAVRLRTFLTGDAGVSAELCVRLAELLSMDLLPAIPRTRIGAAGEIIPLAHLGGALTGSGAFLADAGAGQTAGTTSRPMAGHGVVHGAGDGAVNAAGVFEAAGMAPYSFGIKEGVALIEGVPVTTALAILLANDARLLAAQAIALLSAEVCLVGASRDPFDPALARADAELGTVLGAIRRLAGEDSAPRTLQSPLSFRVLGPAVAHLLRSIAGVEAAVGRALNGVTDSPAYLDGRFIGTAGFDGFDLSASLDGLRLSLIHVAETSAARVHRLLDERFTGLPRQLSGQPGLYAGMVAVHKRTVGVVHELVAAARASSVGAIETSFGQEDVQSFSAEAAEACDHAVMGLRDILACELLTVIQGVRLAQDPLEHVDRRLGTLVDDASDLLPAGTDDRAFGKDISLLNELLASGWGRWVSTEELSIPGQ
ncbi:aromatic amino acid lyase [Arthrobacter sp. 260]|uniref:aromatic amino acid lyase n=1 Tax=Arthrobacter sp. 260 TaxID=2735314 RepID=UPI001493212E|nr:aromatic amino acid lyase [Arthrobacter sp. 260]NOJ60421.1 aromatic amino acid lyase [Arthrobacter sp. 260]